MKKLNDLSSAILIALTAISGVVLIGFHNSTVGWPLMALTTLATIAWKSAPVRNYLLLVLLALVILGLTPINTSITATHIAIMASLLSLTVVIPYGVTRYLHHDPVMTFPIRPKRDGPLLSRQLLIYIAITATIAYLLLPYYLISTESYLNWTVNAGFGSLALLFLGTNLLGIWDELFFVTTVLTLFRRHVSFWYANIAQAALWTAFLYELGFRGWGPLVLFPFSLSQGYIFRRTKSLLYIILIHLTLDFILYLALIHAHHPDWVSIFLLSPHS